MNCAGGAFVFAIVAFLVPLAIVSFVRAQQNSDLEAKKKIHGRVLERLVSARRAIDNGLFGPFERWLSSEWESGDALVDELELLGPRVERFLERLAVINERRPFVRIERLAEFPGVTRKDASLLAIHGLETTDHVLQKPRAFARVTALSERKMALIREYAERICDAADSAVVSRTKVVDWERASPVIERHLRRLDEDIASSLKVLCQVQDVRGSFMGSLLEQVEQLETCYDRADVQALSLMSFERIERDASEVIAGLGSAFVQYIEQLNRAVGLELLSVQAGDDSLGLFSVEFNGINAPRRLRDVIDGVWERQSAMLKECVQFIVPRSGPESGRAGNQRTEVPPKNEHKDPFAYFGLPPGSSRGELEKAYRSMVVQYHPDKVAHLGAELRELAARKIVEINAAREECLRVIDARR